MTQISNKYNLEDRTTKFSLSIIELCKKVNKTIISVPIIDQLIRSRTSIGANYSEANGASSRKDFKNKIDICCKEAKETRYWLRLLVSIQENLRNECEVNWKEANELVLIFGKISSSTRKINS